MITSLTMKKKPVKGHLRSKTISSQNVSYEAMVKNFFILKKIFVSFSRYSSFCIFDHPITPQ